MPSSRGTRSHITRSPSASVRAPGGPPASGVRGPLIRSASSAVGPPAATSMAARRAPQTSSSSAPAREAARAAAWPASQSRSAASMAATSSGVFTAPRRAELRAGGTALSPTTHREAGGHRGAVDEPRARRPAGGDGARSNAVGGPPDGVQRRRR